MLRLGKLEAVHHQPVDLPASPRRHTRGATQAGLTQRALAKLVGATASAIRRIEDADYQGYSLSMLRRVAAALDARVEVRFVRATGGRRSSRSLNGAR